MNEQDRQDLIQLIDSRIDNYFKNSRFEIVEDEDEDIEEFRKMIEEIGIVKFNL